jgi:hypothetical protein
MRFRNSEAGSESQAPVGEVEGKATLVTDPGGP